MINLEDNGPVGAGAPSQNIASVQGNLPGPEGGAAPAQGPPPQAGYGPPPGQQPYYGPPQGFQPGYGPPQGQFVPQPPGHKVSFEATMFSLSFTDFWSFLDNWQILVLVFMYFCGFCRFMTF